MRVKTSWFAEMLQGTSKSNDRHDVFIQCKRIRLQK